MRSRRVGLSLGFGVLVVGGWWWSLPDPDHVDVVVIGDRLVGDARPEIERRLRQAGLVPEVVVVAAGDSCGQQVDSAARRDAVVVLSFADDSGWRSCGQAVADAAVQQPGGSDGSSTASSWRPAAPLFTGDDREACAWWDTPGAGEWKEGLGDCESDGRVTVLEDGTLTLAGRERFARLIVAAID